MYLIKQNPCYEAIRNVRLNLLLLVYILMDTVKNFTAIH